MNNDRRQSIGSIADRLRGLDFDFEGEFNSLKEEIEAHLDEEREYFDAMPESFQQGERGSAAEVAIAALEDAMSFIEEVIGALGSTIAFLEEASQ